MSQVTTIWFSHTEHVWKSEMRAWKPDIKTNKKKKEVWSWDNCYISGEKISENKIRVIVRSKGKIKIRIDKKKTIESIVSFLYDFEISSIPEIEIEEYTLPYNPYQKRSKISGKRRILRLKNERDSMRVDDICEIWEFVSDSNQRLEGICNTLKQIMSQNFDSNKPLIEMVSEAQPITNKQENKIFPIIYQPAIDTTKNFLRQVHIHEKEKNLFEITLVFNNEALRENKILHEVYEDLRKVIYGRTKDVETFYIILENSGPKNFRFKGIYSNNDTIEKDTTHGDKKEWWQFWKKIDRGIKWYYSSTCYPKVFVNTSNHALAEKDNNIHLWKWEYVTWGQNLPIGVGNKSRKVIEKELISDSDFHTIVSNLKDKFSKFGNSF
jgi:hypothetical protein